jgi:hypothetical protein
MMQLFGIRSCPSVPWRSNLHAIARMSTSIDDVVFGASFRAQAKHNIRFQQDKKTGGAAGGSQSAGFRA